MSHSCCIACRPPADSLAACAHSAAAAKMGDALQNVYARDARAKHSETVKAGILEALGLLIEAAPEVLPCHVP